MTDLEKVKLTMKRKKVYWRTDCTFSQLTTYGVGGKIALTLFPNSMKKLVFAVRFLTRNKVAFVLLGQGSNTLASDDFFDGVVIVTKSVNKVSSRFGNVTAQCGAKCNAVFALTKKRQLGGAEFLSCLPGTVGGAVVSNAGCFGSEMKDVVKWVKVLENGKVVKLANKRCRFAKRSSALDGYVVTEVSLKLRRRSLAQITATANEMKSAKSRTQPLGEKSAGSVLFAENCAVSKLIDEMGLKGYRIGGAEVSQKHAGFVVNIDKATAKDIYLLIAYLQNQVLAHYGVKTQREVKLINFGEL